MTFLLLEVLMRSGAYFVALGARFGPGLPLGAKCWKLPQFERLSVNACGVERCCPDIWCRLAGTAHRLFNGPSSVEVLSGTRPNV